MLAIWPSVKAVTVAGTSCSDSARARAVTTTSSSCADATEGISNAALDRAADTAALRGMVAKTCRRRLLGVQLLMGWLLCADKAI